MKKRVVLILMGLILVCSTIGLTACNLSWDGNGGDVVTTLTQLPTPNISEVKDGYIYWEEVPNASSYIVKINSYQESAGNQLKYSISSIMDSKIEPNVPTELHIYVKAKGNQVLYSDSEWSGEFVYTYTKTNSAQGQQTITKCTAEINNNLETDYKSSLDENFYYYVFRLGKIYNVIVNPTYVIYDGSINDVTQEIIVKTADTTTIGSEISEFIQSETYCNYSLSDETKLSHSTSMENSISNSITASIGSKGSYENISGEGSVSGTTTGSSKSSVSDSITRTIQSSKNWGYSNLESLNKNYSQAVISTTESTYKITYSFRKDDSKGKYIVSGELCIIDVFSVVMVNPFTKEYGITNIALINNSSTINSPIFLGEGVLEYKNKPDIKLDLKEFNIETLLTNKPTKDVNGNEIPVGDKLNPIQLNNENFSTIRNDLDKHYILEEDIDLSKYGNWVPIGCNSAGAGANYADFTGSLDGNFHTIKGLKADKPAAISNKKSWQGLFAKLNSGAIVKNLFIECNFEYNHNSEEDNDSYEHLIGAVSAENGNSEIRNVSISGSIGVGKDKKSCGGVYYVGGIVGRSSGETKIICCSVNMDIFVKNNSVSIGGMVGGVSGDGLNILHSYVTGTFEANGNDWFGSHTWTCTGGIIGTSQSYIVSINDCLVYAKEPLSAHGASDDTVFGINTDSNRIGAIIGKTDSKNKDGIVNNAYLKEIAQKPSGTGTIGFAKEFEEKEIHNVSFSNQNFSGLAFCEFKDRVDLIESDYTNCWVYSSLEFPILWFEIK